MNLSTILNENLCFDTFLYLHATITLTGKHSKLTPVNFKIVTRTKFAIIGVLHHLLKLLI